jgi:2-methylcitrate dehydratase
MSHSAATMADDLASFVMSRSGDDLSAAVRDRLKISVLDSLGCGIAGLSGPPVRRLSGYLQETGGAPVSTLIGGGSTSADRAALFNGAAIRYLDFNDTFAARGESCHPSDNIAPVLAVCEQADRSGLDFMVAVAVAYEVQCRLSEAAPVRAKGFDHTVLGILGMAAGGAYARGFGHEPTANAIAIAGTAFNALRVTRTGALSNWKGLAAPNAAFASVHAVALAAHGITGPAKMFEGNKGLIESITGPFEIDWMHEGLSRVLACSVKKYNAEFHSQSAVEAALTLARDDRFSAAHVERIDVETFATGFHIIGGGEEGDKKAIRTREDADHSLPYIIAVALLDGQVMPAQYDLERIGRSDVRNLLARVHVSINPEFSERFPHELCARVTIHQTDGVVLDLHANGYHGFYDDPFTWDDACEKFDALTAELLDDELRTAIRGTVCELEHLESIRALTGLLARVPKS